MPINKKMKYGYIADTAKMTTAFNFTPNEILDAINNSRSSIQAAKYLGISYPTFKAYASKFMTADGTQTLLEYSKQRYYSKIERRNVPRVKKKYTYYNTPDFSHNKGYTIPLEDVLDGKHYGYDSKIFRKRILMSGILPRVCEYCGHSECRKTDGNHPLLVHYKDGDWRNKSFSNIFFLCFNCYFMYVGSLGHYYQGYTYGDMHKPRYDGKEKVTRKKKNEDE